jgi:hypothetical protein
MEERYPYDWMPLLGANLLLKRKVLLREEFYYGMVQRDPQFSYLG